jgi:hypothetical protein
MSRYPQYSPQFKIEIDGGPLPPGLRGSVSSVSYRDGLEGADSVEVTFANPGLQWLDHPLLAQDLGFRLWIGYAPDPLEEVFVGEITGVEPSFPSGGMPTIKITAHDFLNRLTHGKVDRAFAISTPKFAHFPLPDVAIAAIVSASNLLIPYPDPIGGALSALMSLAVYLNTPADSQLAVRTQEGASDFDFLTKIAKENGWQVYIDHTLDPKGYVLRFQFLMQDYAPSLALKWGESLIEFTPRLTVVGDIAAVSSRVWVASLQMEFVIVVSWDWDRAAFELAIYPGIGELKAVLGEKEKKAVSKKSKSFADVVRDILTDLLPRLNNRLTGGGSAVGDPRIKAGRVINFEGLGDSFSGLYRVTSATHTFDGSGYRTSFNARKEVWFGSIPLPKGSSGLIRVQGQRVA